MSLRVAVLSLHSHDERSFLDDRALALVAGDLRAAGLDVELVVAVLARDGALEALVRALADRDVIV